MVTAVLPHPSPPADAPAYATATEALEAVLGPLPPGAVTRWRPLLAPAGAHHVDGPDGYEAEQLAGACRDAHLGAVTAAVRRVAVAAAIVRHPQLAGELAAAAARPDSAVVVAAAWPII